MAPLQVCGKLCDLDFAMELYGKGKLHCVNNVWSTLHMRQTLVPRPVDDCIVFVEKVIPWVRKEVNSALENLKDNKYNRRVDTVFLDKLMDTKLAWLKSLYGSEPPTPNAEPPKISAHHIFSTTSELVELMKVMLLVEGCFY